MTTTAAKAGYFEARFFHKVFQEEFAQARGHFSPINSGASPGGGALGHAGRRGRRRRALLVMPGVGAWCRRACDIWCTGCSAVVVFKSHGRRR